jgi:hypothetical protein
MSDGRCVDGGRVGLGVPTTKQLGVPQSRPVLPSGHLRAMLCIGVPRAAMLLAAMLAAGRLCTGSLPAGY